MRLSHLVTSAAATAALLAIPAAASASDAPVDTHDPETVSPSSAVKGITLDASLTRRPAGTLIWVASGTAQTRIAAGGRSKASSSTTKADEYDVDDESSVSVASADSADSSASAASHDSSASAASAASDVSEDSADDEPRARFIEVSADSDDEPEALLLEVDSATSAASTDSSASASSEDSADDEPAAFIVDVDSSASADSADETPAPAEPTTPTPTEPIDPDAGVDVPVLHPVGTRDAVDAATAIDTMATQVLGLVAVRDERETNALPTVDRPGSSTAQVLGTVAVLGEVLVNAQAEAPVEEQMPEIPTPTIEDGVLVVGDVSTTNALPVTGGESLPLGIIAFGTMSTGVAVLRRLDGGVVAFS